MCVPGRRRDGSRRHQEAINAPIDTTGAMYETTSLPTAKLATTAAEKSLKNLTAFVLISS
jgi:hypothetical protein